MSQGLWPRPLLINSFRVVIPGVGAGKENIIFFYSTHSHAHAPTRMPVSMHAPGHKHPASGFTSQENLERLFRVSSNGDRGGTCDMVTWNEHWTQNTSP